MANTAHAAQSWNPSQYARHAGFVSALGMPVLDLLAPRTGERILDLGCGEGTLMQEVSARGCHVFGVDADPAQVAAARARGLACAVVPGENLAFEREFDAVFSNAVLHWMRDIDAVLAGVHRALRRGGRFVAECGGSGNVAKVQAALAGALDQRGIDGAARVPWHFRSADTYRASLEAAGFQVHECVQFPRPTPLPGDVRAWIETFGESFTRILPEADREAYLDEVQRALAPELVDDTGTWVLDYVRVRFVATR